MTVEQAYQLSKVPPPQVGAVRENVKRRSVSSAAVDAVLPLLSPPLRAAVELI